MLITLEGPEGSGKSTTAAWLAGWFEAHGRSVLRTREPGGTALGEQIRPLLLDGAEAPTPLASLLLFEAARAELVARLIAPALAAGAVVVCDRYLDSTLAYQGFGEGLPLETVRQANLLSGAPLPNLTILLDLDPAVGLARKHGSDGWNSFDARALEFHARVRAGFLQLAAAEPRRWLVIDAAQPQAVIRSIVAARLSRGPQ